MIEELGEGEEKEDVLSVVFIIRHFVLIFVICFVLGVLFLHYSITLCQMNEDALINVLLAANDPVTTTDHQPPRIPNITFNR